MTGQVLDLESSDVLVDVLGQRAEMEPERVAYTFLVDGEEEERSLTQGELEARARRVAVALGQRAAPTRAILLFQPGLDFVVGLFGCFCAGVVAVPVYPPDPRDMTSGLRRIERLALDAGASVVLTTDAVWAWIDPWADRVPDLMRLEWYAIDALPGGSEARWHRPLLTEDSIALLQYTSGSTGTPKGVVVTYGNLAAHARALRSVLSLGPSSVVVSWLPLYHDMGLIGTVLIPMQIGFRSVQMSPLAFLERPQRWLQALSRFQGTLSPAPNFAYDLCVRRIDPDERRILDLRSWVAAINGAEPVRADTCERFIAAFEPCGFRRESMIPCYGLAEATLMVAGGPPRRGPVSAVVAGVALEGHRVVAVEPGVPDARTLVASGRALPGHEVLIVQPDTGCECGPDEVGEIWVEGPSVAAGYWARPEESTATFGARIATSGRGPFLRSGDLGFVRDGELFVTGRRKDLLVIRGRNHYPQDIEWTAAGAHGVLRPGGGAVFAVDRDGEEHVAVVHEVRRVDGIRHDEVAAAIREAVAREHQVYVRWVVLIPPHSLPKTSSGKVQRRACREAFSAGRLAALGSDAGASSAPGPSPAEPSSARSTDQVCEWLVTTIAVLREVSRDRIDRDASLIALGVDSAEAAEVAARLHEWLGRPVPLRLFREHPTIAALARALSVD